MDQMSQVKTLVSENFPFETPNPGQLEVTVWAILELLAGRPHVIIQAPTGIGKSAIASTVHRVMQKLNASHRTTLITATKGLQDQYKSSDRLIFDVKGKTNYTCPINRGPYGSSPCVRAQFSKVCNAKTMCPYVIARNAWSYKAELRSSNTSFILAAPHSICAEEETASNLMIIDECHDLDDNITSHTAFRVGTSSIENVRLLGYEAVLDHIMELVPLFSKYFGPDRWIENDPEITRLSSKISIELILILEDLEGRIKDVSTTEHKRDIYVVLRDDIRKLQEGLSLVGCGDPDSRWIVSTYEEGLAEIKPIYAWQVAETVLYSKAPQFLHMSATICGVEDYAATLGIKDYSYAEVENPIPIENRKIYVMPKFSTGAKFTDYGGLCDLMCRLIDRHLPANGIVHTVSFQLADKLKDGIQARNRRVRPQTSKVRSDIIGILNEHNSSALVLSPSIEKGYDFKGDASRYQIIPKVPFLYLGDPLVRLNADYRDSWYARKAILRIVQACGRSVRGVDDYASTYILDANFVRLYHNNLNLFPKWFRDSLIFVNV